MILIKIQKSFLVIFEVFLRLNSDLIDMISCFVTAVLVIQTLVNSANLSVIAIQLLSEVSRFRTSFLVTRPFLSVIEVRGKTSKWNVMISDAFILIFQMALAQLPRTRKWVLSKSSSVMLRLLEMVFS